MRIRMKNRFGKRYIALRELRDYAVDLDLDTRPPRESLIEFFEMEGLLSPVARLLFPHDILRRFEQEERAGQSIFGPLEADGQRLDNALDAVRTLPHGRWNDSRIYGESVHPLDDPDPRHAPFVVKDFSKDTFVPWSELRPPIFEIDGRTVRSRERFTPAYYHYWQIFFLEALLRSGVKLYYPLEEEGLERLIWRGDFGDDALRNRMAATINIEPRHQLAELAAYSAHFDAVGYFESYSHHALQVFLHDRSRKNGRLSHQAGLRYKRREKELARAAMSRSGLAPKDLVQFVTQQSKWWDETQRRGPRAVADEYKRNIQSTLRLFRLYTKKSPRTLVKKVGNFGHHRPILEVIFPDWVEEQRELAVRSLNNWAQNGLNGLPAPFPVSEKDLELFCDWLENAGLFHFYWHYKRFIDTSFSTSRVDHAATAADAVSFANICEMIANQTLTERGVNVREKTLGEKLASLFGAKNREHIAQHLKDLSGLTRTGKKHSLLQRLAQIRRVKRGGKYNFAIRTLLELVVIRNEGTHLGLSHIEPERIMEMIESMSMAGLLIWRIR